MTRVLPDPAPARIKSGPSPWVTASRWASVRSARRSPVGPGDDMPGDSFRGAGYINGAEFVVAVGFYPAVAGGRKFSRVADGDRRARDAGGRLPPGAEAHRAARGGVPRAGVHR